VPCARLSWPSRQLLSARKLTLSYRIVLIFATVTSSYCNWPLFHTYQYLCLGEVPKNGSFMYLSRFLVTRFPSCHPTSHVEALKTTQSTDANLGKSPSEHQSFM